jgi:Cu(I)/Ag(I) efflux system membrane protein CusA/SilA
MAGAALLSVTLVPVLMLLFIRGKIMPEAKNPVNRFLIWVYRPIIAGVMRWKKLTIAPGLLRCWGVLVPGLAARQRVHAHAQRRHAALHAGLAARHVDHQGRRAAADAGQDHQELPRGGVGLRQGRRANTATDPAPTEMFETVINLKPESVACRHDHRQADRRDGQGAAVPRRGQLLDHADQGAHRHAVHRHPHADRHQGLRQGPGRDGEAGAEIEAVVKAVPGTTSAFAERITGGFYLDIEPDREQLARYGLSVGELLDVVGTALGGEMVTTTVEGRERFGVTCATRASCAATRSRSRARCWCRRWTAPWCRWGRWPRSWSPRARRASAPRTRCCRPTSIVDIRDRDIGGYVADARKAVAEQVKFPPGYYITWSGQFEYMERAIEKLKIVCR